MGPGVLAKERLRAVILLLLSCSLFFQDNLFVRYLPLVRGPELDGFDSYRRKHRTSSRDLRTGISV